MSAPTSQYERAREYVLSREPLPDDIVELDVDISDEDRNDGSVNLKVQGVLTELSTAVVQYNKALKAAIKVLPEKKFETETVVHYREVKPKKAVAVKKGGAK